MTLLTTLLDFSDTGVLDLFIDEAMVQMREMTLGGQPGGGSLLKGRSSPPTFSFLRPNDLVWNYVVGNYLKGETPPPFDLLYWNSDGTNLPGPMYCWYLRNTYLENNLVRAGQADGAAASRSTSARSTCRPTSTRSREDHIVPWQGAYRSRRSCCSGKRRFVLGASGHIAGVINPPAKNKRSHWIGDDDALPADAARSGWPARPSIRAAGGPTGPRWLEARTPASRSPRRRRSATRQATRPIEPAPGPLRQGQGLTPFARKPDFAIRPSRGDLHGQTSSSLPPPAPPSASSAARSPRRRAPSSAPP